MPVRYQPLAAFLAAQPPETAAVTLTLAQIAQLLGQPLPPSASTRAWWGNQPSSPRARAWLAVGWRTQPPQSRQLPVRITFVRAPHPVRGEPTPGTASGDRRSLRASTTWHNATPMGPGITAPTVAPRRR